jgi:hypothetical protein
MNRSERPGDGPSSAAVQRLDVDAARRTDEISRRAAADQAAADVARRGFSRDAVPALPPDERIAPLLAPGEGVVAVRHEALLDRREPAPGTQLAPGVAGALYVTSRRLVFVGRVTLSFALVEVEDAVVSGERLLLVLRDGHGVALGVAQPRLLWVEIAVARAAVRSSQGPGSRIDPPPGAR